MIYKAPSGTLFIYSASDLTGLNYVLIPYELTPTQYVSDAVSFSAHCMRHHKTEFNIVFPNYKLNIIFVPTEVISTADLQHLAKKEIGTAVQLLLGYWPHALVEPPDCGLGWWPIASKLVRDLKMADPVFHSLHMKEKYGILDISAYNFGDESQQLIDNAIEASKTTCELCGASDSKTYTIGVHLKTLCEHHSKNIPGENA